jgi:hypothetical protein
MGDADGRDAVPEAFATARVLRSRPVRVGLAIAALGRAGGAAARQALQADPLVGELPAPPADRWARYPNVVVAHLAPAPLTAGAAVHERLRPGAWRLQLRRLRPDLVLLDGPEGPGIRHREVATEARALGSAVVTVGDRPAPGVTGDLHLRCGLLEDHTSEVLVLPPGVDVRHASPVGRTPGWQPADAVPGEPPTRHHRRLLELAATGTVPLLPPGSPAAALFGPYADLVTRLPIPSTSETPPNGTPTAQTPPGGTPPFDDEALARASVRLRRHVHRHHGTEARLGAILAALGRAPESAPGITVLLASNRPDRVGQALAQVAAQAHTPLSVRVLLHGFEAADAPGLRTAEDLAVEVSSFPAAWPLGAVLDAGAQRLATPLVAKMDDDDLYGPDHLGDLVLALRYSGADAVGRWSHAVYLAARDVTVVVRPEQQERFIHHLPGATLLVPTEVLRRHRWRHVPSAVDTELVRAIHGAGGRTYSTHRFGFVRQRHGTHTFARRDAEFAREGRVTPGLDRSVLTV